MSGIRLEIECLKCGANNRNSTDPYTFYVCVKQRPNYTRYEGYLCEHHYWLEQELALLLPTPPSVPPGEGAA